MKRLLLIAGLAIALVAGCSSPSGPTKTSVPKVLPNPSVGKDLQIRPVPALSGEALTYAQSDTVSQVICQALTKEQWQQIFGPIGRHAAFALSHEPCLIATSAVNLLFTLVDRAPGWQPTTTLGGRPATSGLTDRGVVTASVTLVDDPTRPVLEVDLMLINRPSTSAQQAMVASVLDRLVPVLARPSEPMPKAAGGRLEFVRTKPPAHGGIVDEPSPRQALELCTVLVEHAGYAPDQVTPIPDGECKASKPGKEPIALAITGRSRPLSSYDHRVAKRRAADSVDGPGTVVLLVDGAFIDFTATLPYDDPLLATIVRALVA